jgi:hypothetical protein
MVLLSSLAAKLERARVFPFWYVRFVIILKHFFAFPQRNHIQEHQCLV